MMRMRAALLACVVGVGFANAAQAQIMGRAFELSGQAGAMFFDPRSNFDTGPLVAGSLGWRYAPRVSFELSGMVTKTKHPPGDGDAWFSTLGGDLRLALRDPGSRIVPFMMGGLAYARSRIFDATGVERSTSALESEYGTEIVTVLGEGRVALRLPSGFTAVLLPLQKKDPGDYLSYDPFPPYIGYTPSTTTER